MLSIIKRKIKNYLFSGQNAKFDGLSQDLKVIASKNEELALQVGNLQSKLSKILNQPKELKDVEFKVFSQWGDDGIIQYLINYLDVRHKVFIEFGVEDYQESNTRFLMMNDNWSGLVMDGSKANIQKILNSDYYWKYDLQAKAEFITCANVNDIILSANISGEIGLLHIDIDGNDYWVWKAIDVVQPIIVIVEYNSVFGKERAITIPYKPDFVWTSEHFSNLYFGSSILSLCDLAQDKGYSFVGCNSAGNNAYFIKKEYLKDLTEVSVEEGYVESKFRQSRDKSGRLSYLRGDDLFENIKNLPVYNTRMDSLEKI